MDHNLLGHLIEVLSGLLIFSLGIPVFILQSMFPENLRPLIWRVKRFTIVPVLGLSAGYLFALLWACYASQISHVDASHLRRLIWLTFCLVTINAGFFLFLCAIPPLDAARWLFKRRVVKSEHHGRLEHLNDFIDISHLLVGKRGEPNVHRDLRQILRIWLDDPGYGGNSLERFFGGLKELFMSRNLGGPRLGGIVDFVLGCCDEVVERNSGGRHHDPERAKCPDNGLAWEAVELLAIALIDGGDLLNFKRALGPLENSIERLSRVLWETAARRSGLKFASCLGTVSSVLERNAAMNSTVKARLCAIYAGLDRDSSWLSEGNRRQLGRLLDAHRTMIGGMSADDVVARVGAGDVGLKHQVQRILNELRSGELLAPASS